MIKIKSFLNKFFITAVFGTAILLTGCGGGGGSPTDPDTDPSEFETRQ